MTDAEERIGVCANCVPQVMDRPNDDDPQPEDPLPPRRYSRRWNQEYLGVSGDTDD